MEYQLSDQAIMQVAKALQVAILTGTDVVDNLRLIRFEIEEGGIMTVSETYANEFNEGINRMLEEVEVLETEEEHLTE